MVRLRSARWVMAVALAATVDIAAAQSVAVRIYPLHGEEGAETSIADAQALLESAVPNAARRSERLVPAKPLVLSRTCGRSPAPECIARLAQGGIVLTGPVRSLGGIIVVALRAVEPSGRVHGPVQVAFDEFVQSSEPFVRALLEIEPRLRVPASPGAVAAGPGAPSPAGGTGATERTGGAAADRAPAAAERAAPDREVGAASSVLAYKDPEPVRGAWRRTAGYWASATGVALLAGGATVAALNQRLAKDLEERFHENRLTASDAARYRKVDTYNVVSTALLATGGAATAVGLVLWSTAPDVRPTRGGATFGVQGRF